MIDDPVVCSVVDRFQPGYPSTPLSGRAGELLGRSSGSSLEFQEHRPYIAGDDIRHMDWAAYARTDNLMIRLYRDEISPRTQILLDISRSMSTGNRDKEIAARQLAAAFALMIASQGAKASVLLLGESFPPRELFQRELDSLAKLPFDARGSLAELAMRGQIPLKPRSVRLLISDFLFPHDPEPLIRRLAGDSSLFWVIQVLNRFEANPEELGGRRLIDRESGSAVDLRVIRPVIHRYRDRLHRLQTALREAVQRAGGVFVTVISEEGLEAICARDLCRSRILRPR